MIACIDPGHNDLGQDTGAEGQGYQEQDLALDICLRMKPLLVFNGITPILTREGATVNGPYQTLNQSLQTRFNISNNAGADIFVSVHINAGGGTGTEILIYATGGRAEALADLMLGRLIPASGWSNRGVKVRTNVSVLSNRVDAPSILTENGFIDSANDILKLKEPSFRQALAVAHVRGICDYFGVGYKEEGGNHVLDHAVVYFTAKDFSSALMVADKLGGCATFCRNGSATIHAEAKSAEHLVIVGGPECTDRANVTNCCGFDSPATAILAAQYAQKL